jgi:hypothetical protein
MKIEPFFFDRKFAVLGKGGGGTANLLSIGELAFAKFWVSFNTNFSFIHTHHFIFF